MRGGQQYYRWSNAEVAILRLEMTRGSHISIAQLIKNCRSKMPYRSLSSIANKLEELRNLPARTTA